MKLYYLACPYYHKDPKIMSKRVSTVTRACGYLMKSGFYCFSPITQNHQIRKQCKIESGWKIWEKYDSTLLEHCDELIVLMLEGWKESKGVKAEIELAKKLKMPIRYFYKDF